MNSTKCILIINLLMVLWSCEKKENNNNNIVVTGIDTCLSQIKLYEDVSANDYILYKIRYNSIGFISKFEFVIGADDYSRYINYNSDTLISSIYDYYTEHDDDYYLDTFWYNGNKALINHASFKVKNNIRIMSRFVSYNYNTDNTIKNYITEGYNSTGVLLYIDTTSFTYLGNKAYAVINHRDDVTTTDTFTYTTINNPFIKYKQANILFPYMLSANAFYEYASPYITASEAIQQINHNISQVGFSPIRYKYNYTYGFDANNRLTSITENTTFAAGGTLSENKTEFIYSCP